MSRLPIRLRLTLAFAGVMAVVLVAVGAFLYLRLERNLQASIDQGLRSRAGDVSALVRQAAPGSTDAGRATLIEQEESFAQVLDGRGRVVDGTPQLRGRPLLSAAEVTSARERTLFLEQRQPLRGRRAHAAPGRARERSGPGARRGGRRLDRRQR